MGPKSVLTYCQGSRSTCWPPQGHSHLHQRQYNHIAHPKIASRTSQRQQRGQWPKESEGTTLETSLSYKRPKEIDQRRASEHAKQTNHLNIFYLTTPSAPLPIQALRQLQSPCNAMCPRVPCIEAKCKHWKRELGDEPQQLLLYSSLACRLWTPKWIAALICRKSALLQSSQLRAEVRPTGPRWSPILQCTIVCPAYWRL